MTFSVTNVRLDGCLFGPPSQRDFRTVFRDRTVPDRVDLRPFCTAVENQGMIGSCTANAAVGALEYHYKRQTGSSPELSRMFVYYNSRRMRGQVMMDTGAEIREAMASVMAFGVCREELWPYDPALFALEPPPAAYNDATVHEAMQYARVDGGQGAVSALVEGLPVVFGTRIPMRCYEQAATTGMLPAPSAEELRDPTRGGHAMLIVGYDNTERVFIVRNSWGEEWGERGYCRIPFDVIDACSRPEDFWVVAELVAKTGFELVRPGAAVAAAPKPGHRVSDVAAIAANMRDEIRAGLQADLTASSRKIDALFSGRARTPAAAAPRASTTLLPCTACAGSGICPFCHGRKCARCAQSGAWSECAGTGVI